LALRAPGLERVPCQLRKPLLGKDFFSSSQDESGFIQQNVANVKCMTTMLNATCLTLEPDQPG
jgi:hypothetical protein